MGNWGECEVDVCVGPWVVKACTGSGPRGVGGRGEVRLGPQRKCGAEMCGAEVWGAVQRRSHWSAEQ